MTIPNNNDKYDKAECQALGCHNKKRDNREFCSDECERATEEELRDAPYGDHYAFPTLPAD